MSSMIQYCRFAVVACVAVVVLVGCGGGGSGSRAVYLGDVEVDNQTDLGGTWEDLYSFEMAPAGTQFWTGNLLPGVVHPGEIVFVGTFEEDYYDAEADLELGFVTFFDEFVSGAATTTFEVY